MAKPVPRAAVKICGCCLLVWRIYHMFDSLFLKKLSAYAKTATHSSSNSNQNRDSSMVGSRTDPSSGGFVVNDRAKEENHEAKRHHHKETHGLRDDIDEETPVADVKAPNVFERAKEEFEAVAEAFHAKKGAEIETHRDSFSHDKKRDSTRKEEMKPESSDSHSENSKSPNLFERAKEDIEALIHKQKSPHRHHKETHGTSNDIDENTPISEVKGPSVFRRAKEELEAILGSISLTKKEEGGFGKSIGRGLEKVRSPGDHNRG